MTVKKIAPISITTALLLLMTGCASTEQGQGFLNSPEPKNASGAAQQGVADAAASAATQTEASPIVLSKNGYDVMYVKRTYPGSEGMTTEQIGWSKAFGTYEDLHKSVAVDQGRVWVGSIITKENGKCTESTSSIVRPYKGPGEPKMNVAHMIVPCPSITSKIAGSEQVHTESGSEDSQAHIDTHPAGSVEMMILGATTKPTDGDTVQLQETVGQKCMYVGRLNRGGQIDNKVRQILSLQDNNRYHWSITIDRQHCYDGVSREVHLVAPLSVTAGLEDFKDGVKVLAFPEKANSGLTTERDVCLSNLRGLAEMNAVKQGFVVLDLYQGSYATEADGGLTCKAQFQIMRDGKSAFSQVFSGQIAKQSK